MEFGIARLRAFILVAALGAAATGACAQQSVASDGVDPGNFGETLAQGCAACHQLSREDSDMAKLFGLTPAEIDAALARLAAAADAGTSMGGALRELGAEERRALAGYLGAVYPTDPAPARRARLEASAKTTKPAPKQPALPPSVAPEIDAGVAEAQGHLNRIGYNVGPVDGVWGQRSQLALETYLATRDWTEPARLTAETLEMLRVEPAASPEVAPQQQVASAPTPAVRGFTPVAELTASPTPAAGRTSGETPASEPVVGSGELSVASVEVAPLAPLGAEPAETLAPAEPSANVEPVAPVVRAAPVVPSAPADQRDGIQGAWTGVCTPIDGGGSFDIAATVDGARFEASMRLQAAAGGESSILEFTGEISRELDIDGAFVCGAGVAACGDVGLQGEVDGVFPALSIGLRTVCLLSR